MAIKISNLTEMALPLPDLLIDPIPPLSFHDFADTPDNRALIAVSQSLKSALVALKAELTISSTQHTHDNLDQLALVTDGDHDVRVDNPHATTPIQIAAADRVHAHVVADVTGLEEEVTGLVLDHTHTLAEITDFPPTGIIFPESPVAGQRLFRTDLNREFFWDAVREKWLSTDLVLLAFGLDGSAADDTYLNIPGGVSNANAFVPIVAPEVFTLVSARIGQSDVAMLGMTLDSSGIIVSISTTDVVTVNIPDGKLAVAATSLNADFAGVSDTTIGLRARLTGQSASNKMANTHFYCTFRAKGA